MEPINQHKPLKDGTRLMGFVKAAKNKPPRQCDHCIWYKQDRCLHPVAALDPEMERDAQGLPVVDDLDCCDYFQCPESILVYCLRHGDTALNDSGCFRGWMDVELNDTGREQAKAAGKFLKGKGIVCIVSSPLKRAKETAEIVAKEIGIAPESILELRSFLPWDVGQLSGQSKKENDHIIQHALDNPEWPLPDGESVQEFGERHREGLEWVTNEAERESGPILVVFHTSNIIQTEHWVKNEPESARPEEADSVTPGGVVALIKDQTKDGEKYRTEPLLGAVGSETHYGS